MALFQLGQVIFTAGINALLQKNSVGIMQTNLTILLQRHQNGDSGNVCKEDKEANDYAIAQGERIFSTYTFYDTVTIWIITEHDRSYTTVLLPEEY